MSKDSNKDDKADELFKMLKGIKGSFEFGDCTGAGGFGNCSIILTPKGTNESHIIEFNMDIQKVEAITKSSN